MGAITIDPLTVIVGRRLTNELGAKMGWSTHGSTILGRAGIGSTDHADIAIAPVLSRSPLDGVVAITQDPCAVIPEGVEVTVRGETSTHILNQNGITAPGEEFRRPHTVL